MILGSDPVDKEATNGPPLRSEANNVSITDGPLNSIKTQAINSPPASCPLDPLPSQAEQMLMVLGSGPVDKEATNGPPMRSEANNVSISDDPLSSIETQAIHSPPVSYPLDPLPSTASQATAVFPLKSDSSVKIVETQQQVRDGATLQARCPVARHSCISSAPTLPYGGWRPH